MIVTGTVRLADGNEAIGRKLSAYAARGYWPLTCAVVPTPDPKTGPLLFFVLAQPGASESKNPEAATSGGNGVGVLPDPQIVVE